MGGRVRLRQEPPWVRSPLRKGKDWSTKRRKDWLRPQAPGSVAHPALAAWQSLQNWGTKLPPEGSRGLDSRLQGVSRLLGWAANPCRPGSHLHRA